MCFNYQSAIDCCSKPDHEQTARLVEFCGFRLAAVTMQAIKAGKCTEVTIDPNGKEGAVVKVQERGQRKRTYPHPLGEASGELVKAKIKEFFPPEKEKPVKQYQTPAFIRPGHENDFRNFINQAHE